MKVKNHRILETSLKILNFIAEQDHETSFKEICDELKIPKSTAYNIIQTLVNLNYLHRNDNGRFSIGLKCFEVGNAYLTVNPFFVQAKEIIESISKRCNETTHFAILDGTDIVYLYKFDSTQPIRIFSHIGKRMPAHATAVGKAILSAYSDEEIINMYPDGKLKKLTENTITSLHVLIEQLREVRKNGIAYENGESTPFVQCIGVPILSKQKKPVAGISIAIPTYRAPENMDEFKSLLLEAKEQLEAILV